MSELNTTPTIVATTTAPTNPEPAKTDGLDWSTISRWASALGLASAVLALELLNHAPNGTFLALVAGPGLAALGLHTAAKNLS